MAGWYVHVRARSVVVDDLATRRVRRSMRHPTLVARYSLLSEIRGSIDVAFRAGT
jgi:hypothetical protein